MARLHACIGVILALFAAQAFAQAPDARPAPAVEFLAGYAGFADDATIDHELFAGTERVRRGDFVHKIAIRSRDQLGELAGSFNSMTASIEGLLREKAEKERLEQELRIARSIQMSLLPQGPFDMHTADDSILSSLHCTCRFSSWSARKDVGARTDHHDVGSRLAASAFREDQKVRIARSLVNRFERNKSVDFHLACAIKLAARDESRDLVDVSRWWTIGCQRWHLFAHERVHACQRR